MFRVITMKNGLEFFFFSIVPKLKTILQTKQKPKSITADTQIVPPPGSDSASGGRKTLSLP